MTRFCALLFLLSSAGALLVRGQASTTDSVQTLLAPAFGSRIMLADSGPHRPPAFLTIQPLLSTVAGVQVTPTSGEPGAWNTLRIRGLTGLGSQSQPLVVLDGLPMLNADIAPQLQVPNRFGLFKSDDAPFVDGPGASPLLGLPLADIASIEVLKGAAATARYGAQGSYGVLLLTTRRGGRAGQAQPLRVRYEGWAGVQQVRQRYELLDGRQQATLTNELVRDDGGPPEYSAAQLAAFGRGSDWQGEVFRAALVQSHHLSAAGSTGRTRYHGSANYLNQAGVVRGTGLARYGLRLNLEHQLGTHLRVFGQVGFTQLSRDRPDPALVSQAVLTSPLISVYNADGSYATGLPGYPFSLTANPLARANIVGSTGRTDRLLSQLGISWQVAPGLSFTGRGGYERSVLHSEGWGFDYNPANAALARSTPNQTQQRHAYTRTAEARLHYLRPSPGPHTLEGALSYLAQQFETLAYDSSFTRFGGSLGYQAFRLWQQQKVNTVLAHGRYAYAGRYELTASLRADEPGSFRPGGGVARYWYAGAEACWHAGQTKALAGRFGLSAVDVRAGWGQTSTLLFGRFVPVVSGSFTGPLPTPDRTTQHDASLHLGWLQSRLQLTLGAYQRRTAQGTLVLGLPLPGGGFFPFTVETTVLNRGLELTLAADWQRGRLHSHTTATAAFNRHRLETVSDVPSGALTRLTAGEPLNTFLLATRLAPDPRTGQARYATITYTTGGFSQTVIDHRYQGSGLPAAVLNLTQQLAYGPWELSAQLDALLGYSLLNVDQAQLDSPRLFGSNSPLVLDRWTPANPNSSIPAAPNNGNFFELSDANLSSGDHLRLSQLTLGYQFMPATPHPITVWAGGQNLFVLTAYRGFDPNVSSGGSAPLLAGFDYGTYPVARTWLLGVRAAF